VAEPLAEPLDQLDRAWGAVRHLNAVVSTPEWRSAYHASLPKVTAFFTDLAQDLRSLPVTASLRRRRRSPRSTRRSAGAVTNELRDFRLGGAELPAAQKARLKVVEEELAEVSARFDDNLLDATNAWALYVTERNELTGIPESVLDEAAPRRKPTAGRLEAHAAHAVLPAGRELRRQSRAPRDAASGVRHARFRSGGIARVGQRARHPAPPPAAARSRAAPRLSEFAALSLVPKMAKSVDDVLAFLRDLARRARPYATRDYAELEAFAAAELGLADLQPWDRAYASEKLKARKFAFSEQEVRRYFPEGKVLEGLFRVAETLYGISIRASKAATWHPDVRFFDVVDAAGALIGQFYLDNYARPGKQGGAWQDDAINRRRTGRMSSIRFRISPATSRRRPRTSPRPSPTTKSSRSSTSSATGLHHLLTRVEVAGVSGIQGVEWDAVELPSQFMENSAGNGTCCRK
jgi:oligopeptidase A